MSHPEPLLYSLSKLRGPSVDSGQCMATARLPRGGALYSHCLGHRSALIEASSDLREEKDDKRRGSAEAVQAYSPLGRHSRDLDVTGESAYCMWVCVVGYVAVEAVIRKLAFKYARNPVPLMRHRSSNSNTARCSGPVAPNESRGSNISGVVEYYIARVYRSLESTL